MDPSGDIQGRLLRQQLDRLRRGRRPGPRPAMALGDFLPNQFKRECERPYRRLGKVAEVWQATVPPRLVAQTSLASFNRGVLTVQVPDPTVSYDLERVLAGGLEQAIRRSLRGATLRRIKVVVNPDLKPFPS